MGLAFGRAVGRGVIRFRGLRSRTAKIGLRTGVPMTLSRYEHVPGVYVSGTANLNPGAEKRHYDLRATGPAATPGEIHVRGRAAYGILGGRPFRVVLLPPGK